MNATFSLFDVRSIAAKSTSLGTSHWVDLTVANGTSRIELVLFFDTQDIAEAYANAINYANASTAVQTNHDRQLSDAGIQEYRAMKDEVA